MPAEQGEDPDAYKLPKEKLEPLQAKAKAAGLWCLATPEDWGGGGLGMLPQALVAEEAAKCRMGAYVPACGAFGFDPPSVVFESGTPEQIERYAVPAVETGEKSWVAISEAAGGSDPARSIETTARREGDNYLLSGSKFWITGGMGGRWVIANAAASPAFWSSATIPASRRSRSR